MNQVTKLIKETIGISSAEEKRARDLTRLEEAASEKFQVAEWNAKLYITIDGVPVKDSYENIGDIISELQQLRSTWVEYMSSRPSQTENFLRARVS